MYHPGSAKNISTRLNNGWCVWKHFVAGSARRSVPKINNTEIDKQLIKSTIFNFLQISQLIQKVLQSNFSKLVLNLYIKISKSCFCVKREFFRSKFQPYSFFKCPKVRPLLEFLSQSFPIVKGHKVFWINMNFSKMESVVMSVDVSLRQKKNASVLLLK